MGVAKLGVMTAVDVKNLWKHEQYDFSNWLAKDENIEYLNEILGLTLVDVNKEVYVGAYRCDLVAKDETTGIKVIIENQLEASNHDHLGKIITYASGLDAQVIVWIVTQAREEHRSAIEWLNNNTGNNLNFFLIELHAYTIGDSLPAPKFEVVEKPNGFIKNSKVYPELSKVESERLEFWMKFNEMIAAKGKPFNIRKPSTKHWYDVNIGRSGVTIAVCLSKKESCVTVELYINEDKALFNKLYQQQETIENAIGRKLEWTSAENKKASRILARIPGLNFSDHSNYPRLMEEAIDMVIKMRDVFKPII